jgi:hypothetical protein
MEYILIKNGKVENIIIADAAFVKSIKYDWDAIVEKSKAPDAAIGYSFKDGVFSAPVAESRPIVVKSKITKFAFVTRFTDAEAVTLDLASRGNSIQEAYIRRYMQKIELAQFVDLSLQDTINGVYGLEQAGLLNPGRAKEILEKPVQESELYKEIL